MSWLVFVMDGQSIEHVDCPAIGCVVDGWTTTRDIAMSLSVLAQWETP
jgi:hypothetical protein